MEKSYSRDEILKNSIILVGPAGVGKTVVSKRLSFQMDYPVICLDMLRHCPRDINVIVEKKDNLEEELYRIAVKTKDSGFLAKEDEGKVEYLKNEIWITNSQIKMRKLLPNLQNYEDMGFTGKVSNYLRDNFGPKAWHFYQKQFENELLSSVLKQINEPCIIDTGGGMAISLDSDYEKLRTNFLSLDKELYEKYFNEDKIGFKHIVEALKPFKKVVALQLPSNYKNSMSGARAAKDPLNEAFIMSNQYNEIAKQIVNTDGLIEENIVNEEALNNIVSQIIDKKNRIKK